jgi:translocation and assembly module TamA
MLAIFKPILRFPDCQSSRVWQIIMLICCLSAIQPSQALQLAFMNQGIPYQVKITDENISKSAELAALIEDTLIEQRAENPALSRLTDSNKIARFEQDIILRLLKSQGYYQARVEVSFQTVNTSSGKNSKNEQTLQLVYQVFPGKHYLIQVIDFSLPGVDPAFLAEIKLEPGQPLIAENILQVIAQIQNMVRQQYCFYEFNLDYQVTLDHRNASASVLFTSEPAQVMTFGPIHISGLESIDEDFIRMLIHFQENDCFQRDKVDQARLALLRSNLIANVQIEMMPTTEHRVNTRFLLNERHHRSIKAGLGYSTDEQEFISAGWEHRNIGGSAEKIEVNSRASAYRQKLEGSLFIPTFFTPQTSLNIFSELTREDLDAYKALALKSGAKIGFTRSKALYYATGVELKLSDVEDQGQQDDFQLLSLPLELQWNKTNSVLDPTSGYLISAELRPYTVLNNTDIQFFKSLLSFSAYHTFETYLQPTFAARYSLGSITGESVSMIPADERFYVGGGGSVRGYPYQSLSRLDGDDPQGGASFQQINTELRLRFTPQWGLAMFVGGGFAFEQSTPAFDEDLLWGSGVGLRYYTSFAPLRMDLAFPMNRRKGYDDAFQLYISIGQAF